MTCCPESPSGMMGKHSQRQAVLWAERSQPPQGSPTAADATTPRGAPTEVHQGMEHLPNLEHIEGHSNSGTHELTEAVMAPALSLASPSACFCFLHPLH